MNCDHLARWYALAEHAAFGRALERRRSCYLNQVRDKRSVLALGDGDGRALVALLAACPHAQIEYIDLSAHMLAMAKNRVGSCDRVQWAAANALQSSYPNWHYDLIVTHFFLDCLDEAQVNALTKRLVRAMQPGASWIVSEFRAESWWSRALVRGLYFFFRVTTGLKTRRLPEYRTILENNGLRLMQVEQALGGFLVSELWRLS